MNTQRSKRKNVEFTPKPHSTAKRKVETDCTKLLKVFPEELWRSLLANVCNANTYFGLCGASPFFKNLLSHKRIRYLLEVVVQKLFHRSELNQHSKLFLKAFVALRQVSRDWKEGIDSAFQNLPSNYEFTEEPEAEGVDIQTVRQPVGAKYVEVFQRAFDFTAFETFHDASHLATTSNPFITRGVEICLPEQKPELLQFFTTCANFVQKYGHHVWYLTVKGNITPSYSSDIPHQLICLEFSDFLKNLLLSVPNLRVLQYKIRNVYRCCERFTFQLPPFKKLVFMDMVGMPYGMFEEQLKAQLPFANITQVGLTLNAESKSAMHSNSQDIFRIFCEIGLPLVKLRIDFCEYPVDWNVIFFELEANFGETLIHLDISLPAPGLFPGDRSICLPNLRVLKLALQEPVPLDFLLEVAQTLEQVNLIMLKPIYYEQLKRVRRQEQKIEFYHSVVGWRQLHSSNICNLFHKLKELTVRGYFLTDSCHLTCTRAEWRAKNRKNIKFSKDALPCPSRKKSRKP